MLPESHRSPLWPTSLVTERKLWPGQASRCARGEAVRWGRSQDSDPVPLTSSCHSFSHTYSSLFCYKKLSLRGHLLWQDLTCGAVSLLRYILSIFYLPAFLRPNDAHRDVIFSLLFFYYHLIWPLLTLPSAAPGTSLGALLSSHPDFMRSIYFHVSCICLDVFLPSW